MTRLPAPRLSMPTLSLALPILALTATLLATPALAQLPETFDNLQVLPEDVPRGELIQTMRSFSFALGVRCHHCHVGQEGQPMSEWNFASDEKATKRTARVMMSMTREINESLLPRVDQVEGRPAHTLSVSCVTCHRGVAKPRTLESLLAEVIAQDGAEAAVSRYRELREAHHGQGSYDFGEWTLLRLAEQLARESRSEATIAVLELNAETFPESASTRLMLGRALLAAGDREAARRELELARDLGHPQAATVLEEVETSKSAEREPEG